MSKRKTARRGSGEGSITQRADGRWMARIEAGYSSTGKRIRRTVYGKTKKVVQNKLDEMKAKKRTGTLIEASQMTVAEWLDHWLNKVAKNSVRHSTWGDYERTVRLHIKPYIGSLKLGSVSKHSFRGFGGIAG